MVDLLEDQFKIFQFTPDRLFNIDESGLSTVSTKPPKPLARMGSKQVGIIASGEK